MSLRSLRPSALLAAALLPLLAALLATPQAAVARDRDDNRAEQAQAALSAVEELLAGTPAGDHADLTLALRDLFLAKDELTGADRTRAESILARPSDGDSPGGVTEPKYTDGCGGLLQPDCPTVHRTCGGAFCVHYVTDGPHATSHSYATTVRKAIGRSHRKYRNWNYRPPLPDTGKGGDRRRDIYLADLDQRLFGYAAPEGYYVAGGDKAAWGYLVLDRDYRTQCEAYYNSTCGAWFRHRLMRVTAAHEYFHLVQFGYDYTEDSWLLEATATWAEDEVFDGVNDSRGFLHSPDGVLKAPGLSLDSPHALPYANWIFFRYFSERYGRKVVRQAWQRADAWRGWNGGRNPPDKYSMQAVKKAIQKNGSWSRDLAKFHDANRRTRRHYEEGWAYPNSPLRKKFPLWQGNRRKVHTPYLDHVSATTFRVTPGNLKRGWKLKIKVSGPVRYRGFAVATFKRNDGRLGRVKLRLGRNGEASRTVPFGWSKVRWVDITLANTSTRYTCWTDGGHSCDGSPRDENRRFTLVTRALRS